jgi:hypothetical protein
METSGCTGNLSQPSSGVLVLFGWNTGGIEDYGLLALLFDLFFVPLLLATERQIRSIRTLPNGT